ncbi:MAG TPA: hypothetical protein VNW89_03855, partial [Stellaceae bacterium]|nr:hypothetical protein [Stellaceae bacterium]
MSEFANTVKPVVDALPLPTVPNLADPVMRTRLTPASVDGVVRLAEIWRLTGAEVCSLLGDVSERT